MSEDSNNSSGGGGCLLYIGVAALLFFGMMIGGGGDATSNTTTTSIETRSGVLSGNQTELLSRNQLNLFSEVWNCFGDASCIITTEMITNTTTSTTNAPVTVDGDSNVVSGGLRLCVDAQGSGYQTYEQCRPGYMETKP